MPAPGTVFGDGATMYTDNPSLMLTLGAIALPDAKNANGDALKHFRSQISAADKFAEYSKKIKGIIESKAQRLGRANTEITFNDVWNFETYVVDTKTAAPIGYLSWGFAVNFSIDANGDLQIKIIDLAGPDSNGDETVNKGSWQWHNGVDKDVWDTYPKK